MLPYDQILQFPRRGWPIYRWLLSPPLTRQSRSLVLATVLMGASVMLQVPLALVTRHIVDVLLPTRNARALTLVVLGLAVLMLVKGVVDVWQTYVTSRAREHVVMDVQMRLLSHVQRLSLSFFRRSRSAYLSARIATDSSVIGNTVTSIVLPAVREVLMLLCAGAIVLTFQWRLGLASLLVLPFFIASLLGFARKRKRCATDYQESYAVACEVLTESLSAIEVLKTCQAEAQERERVDQALRRRTAAFIRMSLTSSLSTFVTGFVAGLGPLVILWYGGRMVVTGEMTLGTLMAFSILVGYLFSPAQRLITMGSEAQSSLAALDRICELLSTEPEVDDPPQPIGLNEVSGAISFRNVSFSYLPDQPILKNINLEVPAGHVVAIVGRNGAGKTTLVNLIPRLFDPTTGAVCIDGIDIKHVKQADLRSVIAVVPQETILLCGTIRDNIRYGFPDAREVELMDAATAAHVCEFLDKLPNGFDTEVGERGTRLSGGQRQRIAIARAMLRNPRILILDEATSEIDVESELLIQAALGRLLRGRTTFIIAHRLATVVNADVIVILDNGSILDQGAHHDLLKRCMLYRDLCKTQFLDEFSPARSWEREEW